MVGGQPLAQIFLFCGLLETIFHKGKLTVEDMHNNGEEPGSFGFGKRCCCCYSNVAFLKQALQTCCMHHSIAYAVVLYCSYSSLVL